MGSYINFENFGDTYQGEGSGAKPAVIFPLARQSSVYSLTIDELQNSFGGVGKDFGSMNMDELLKNIWTAESTQPMTSSTSIGEGMVVPNGYLQKQGSLTLPRTLSQKTVDEVWRDLLKESENIKNGSGTGNGGQNLPQRQATLGEMTLEEFLLRAGVVGEATHPIGRPNNGGFYGDVSQQNNNNSGLNFGFQQTSRNHDAMGDQIISHKQQIQQTPRNHDLMGNQVISHQQQQQPKQQQPLFPKQATVAFDSPINLGTRGPIVGRADPSMNNSLVQSRVAQSGVMGMASLASRTMTNVAGSPKKQLISNRIPKSDVDTSSLSPSPYPFNEGARGRKPGGPLEKVVERRRRRMIKNRESAARSRARKQAYTLELEAEVAKLKEVIEDLQKKQDEFLKMQKNQMLEKMNTPWGSKRVSLRRTLTGPW